MNKKNIILGSFVHMEACKVAPLLKVYFDVIYKITKCNLDQIFVCTEVV